MRILAAGIGDGYRALEQSMSRSACRHDRTPRASRCCRRPWSRRPRLLVVVTASDHQPAGVLSEVVGGRGSSPPPLIMEELQTLRAAPGRRACHRSFGDQLLGDRRRFLHIDLGEVAGVSASAMAFVDPELQPSFSSGGVDMARRAAPLRRRHRIRSGILAILRLTRWRDAED